jgi:hypothetical protein
MLGTSCCHMPGSQQGLGHKNLSNDCQVVFALSPSVLAKCVTQSPAPRIPLCTQASYHQHSQTWQTWEGVPHF